MDKLQLPGGAILPIPHGTTAEQVYWRHSCMSLSEGLCPRHQSPLEPVPAKDGGIGAHCPRCGYWHLDPVSQDVSWHIDHNPYTGEPLIPEWAHP
jgi:hypothetical protein